MNTAPPTLHASLSSRNNALNFVRLLLAATVVFSHSWPLGGFAGAPPVDYGAWAVNAFFVISGYLIAGSRMRLRFWSFLANRVFRIYPAYWTVLVLTGFVLAPLSASSFGWDYSLKSAFWYVIKNSTLYINQYDIWDTLAQVPFPLVWNGSLWTLFYEFLAYVLAGLLLSIPFVRRWPRAVIASLLLLVLVVQVLSVFSFEVSSHIYSDMLRLFPYFLAGMLFYFLGDKIRMRARFLLVPVVVFSILALMGFAELFGQVFFACAVLWLGARLPFRLGANNDISYGVYIWAFPVQQVLAAAGTSWLGPWGSGLVALSLTFPLAWLSWQYVEKPAMGLRKRIFPSRAACSASTASPDGNSQLVPSGELCAACRPAL